MYRKVVDAPADFPKEEAELPKEESEEEIEYIKGVDFEVYGLKEEEK